MNKSAIRNDTVYGDGLILKADIQNTSPGGTISVAVGSHPRGSTATFASFQVAREAVVRKVKVVTGATWPEGSNPSLDPREGNRKNTPTQIGDGANVAVDPISGGDSEVDAIVPDLLRHFYEGRAGESAT